jgi:hypothetical protein
LIDTCNEIDDEHNANIVSKVQSRSSISFISVKKGPVQAGTLPIYFAKNFKFAGIGAVIIGSTEVLLTHKYSNKLSNKL